MFSRKFDRRVYAFLIVLTVSLVFGVSFGTYALDMGNIEKGFQPEQPVYFPHSLMAGKRGIDCLYCHTQAESSAHATVPPVSVCMKCHKEVQPKNAEGEVKDSIKKLLEYWESGKPIEWVKVHDLADFVYFDHSRHLTKKAGLVCADCHGQVEKMDRVKRVNTLKMSWCLACHRQPPPEGAPPEQKTRAPTHCSTCHR
jgi:hypothetical protein